MFTEETTEVVKCLYIVSRSYVNIVDNSEKAICELYSIAVGISSNGDCWIGGRAPEFYLWHSLERNLR